MIPKDLDHLLRSLKARYAKTKRLDKKTKILIRLCLWEGANVPHFKAIGLGADVVMPIYQAMPENYHMARTIAVTKKNELERINS